MNGIAAAPGVGSITDRAERILRSHFETALRTLKRQSVIQQHHQIRFIAARALPPHTQDRSRTTAGSPDALLRLLLILTDTWNKILQAKAAEGKHENGSQLEYTLFCHDESCY